MRVHLCFHIHLHKRLSFDNSLRNTYIYENKENLQMYAIVKLGCSPNSDGFEANFKSIV